MTKTTNVIVSMLNSADAAAYLATTPGRLANMRYLSVGPEYVKIGSAIRYRINSLDAYIAANTVKPGA